MKKVESPFELLPIAGFPVYAFDSNSNNYVDKSNTKNLFLPRNVVEVLEELKGIGLFNKNEKDMILVNAEGLARSHVQAFTIARGTIADDMISLFDVFNSTKAQPSLYSHGIQETDNTTAAKFINMAKNRFAQYSFTPENGWSYMYYLDLITDWHYVWSEEEIKLLSEYNDKDFSMNTAALLYDHGVAVKDMHHAIGMPASWVKQMYGV